MTPPVLQILAWCCCPQCDEAWPPVVAAFCKHFHPHNVFAQPFVPGTCLWMPPRSVKHGCALGAAKPCPRAVCAQGHHGACPQNLPGGVPWPRYMVPRHHVVALLGKAAAPSVGISAGRELAADAQPAALRGGASTLIAQGPGPRKANPRGVIRGGKYSGVHFWTLFRARKSVNKKGGCTVVAEYFVDGFRGCERCPLLVLISVPRLMPCVFLGGP